MHRQTIKELLIYFFVNKIISPTHETVRYTIKVINTIKETGRRHRINNMYNNKNA